MSPPYKIEKEKNFVAVGAQSQSYLSKIRANLN
jgi:hypothetical protein